MPKKRDTTPVRTSAKKPIRSTDSPPTSKPQSMIWQRNLDSKPPSSSPPRGSLGVNSTGTSVRRSSTAGTPWRMPRRSQVDTAAPEKSKSARASYKGPPRSPVRKPTWIVDDDDDVEVLVPPRPQSERGVPRRKSGSAPRRPVNKPTWIVDDDDDAIDDVEVLVPPRPQSERGVPRRKSGSAEKRRSVPVQNRSMNGRIDRKKKTNTNLTPIGNKSFKAERKSQTIPVRNKSLPNRGRSISPVPPSRAPGASAKKAAAPFVNLRPVTQDAPKTPIQMWQRNSKPSQWNNRTNESSKASPLDDDIPQPTMTPPKKKATPGKQPKTPKFDWQRMAAKRKQQIPRSLSPLLQRDSIETSSNISSRSPLNSGRSAVRQTLAQPDRSPVRDRSPVPDRSPVRDRSPVGNFSGRRMQTDTGTIEAPARTNSNSNASQRGFIGGRSQVPAIRSSAPRLGRSPPPGRFIGASRPGRSPPPGRSIGASRPGRSTPPGRSIGPRPGRSTLPERPTAPRPEHLGRYAASGGFTGAGRYGKTAASPRSKQYAPRAYPPHVKPRPVYQPPKFGPVSQNGPPPGRRKPRPAAPGRGRGSPVRGGTGQGRGRVAYTGRGRGRGRGRGTVRVPTQIGGPTTVADTLPSPEPEPKKKSFPKARMKGLQEMSFNFPSISNLHEGDEAAFDDIYKADGSIRILICSANLGNAQPDDLSLNEWVPSDGFLEYAIINPPRYPVFLNTRSEPEDEFYSEEFVDSSLLKLGSIDEYEITEGLEEIAKYDEEADSRAIDPVVQVNDDGIVEGDEAAESDEARRGDDNDTGSSQLGKHTEEEKAISQPNKEIIIETVQEDDSDTDSVLVSHTVEVKREQKDPIPKSGNDTPEPSAEIETESLETDDPVSLPPDAEGGAPGLDMPDSTGDDVAVSRESTAAALTPNETPSFKSEQYNAHAIESGTATKPGIARPSLNSLSPMREKIERSVRSSSNVFEFGDAFHARQRAAHRDEKEKEREARERLQKGTVAPDFSFGEAFGEKQTAAMRDEKEKERQAKERIHQGTVADLSFGGAFGEKQTAAMRNEKAKKRDAMERIHQGTVAPHLSFGETFDGKIDTAMPEERLREMEGEEMILQGSLADSNTSTHEMTRNASNPQSHPSAVNIEGDGDEKTTPEESGNDDEATHEFSSFLQATNGTQMPTNEAADRNPEANVTVPIDPTYDGQEGSDSLPANGNEGFGEFGHHASNQHAGDRSVEFVNSTDNEWALAAGNGEDENWNADEGGWADDGGWAGDWHQEDQFEEDNWSNSDPFVEQQSSGHFEIIVIGMQEATFDTQHEQTMDRKEHVPTESERLTESERTARSIGTVSSEESDQEAAEEEESKEENGSEDYSGVIGIPGEDQQPFSARNFTKSDGDLPILEDEPFASMDWKANIAHSQGDEDDEDADEHPTSERISVDSKTKESKPKKKMGVFGAAMKAGKKTLRAGKKTLKAGKKTAKAAQTLISEKNHTNREPPTAQQMSAPTEEGGMAAWEDTDVLHYMFDGQLPSYQRALSYQLGEMRLMVYYLKTAVELDVLSVNAKPTGKHNLANKGGIVTEVAVNGSTRLCFSSAHLEAHEGEEKFEKRCSSFQRIFNGAKSSVTPLPYDSSMASHFSFFMGDLNFRTKLPNIDAGSHAHILASHDLAAEGDWETLNQHDELSRALAEKKCLVGWKTPYCNFDPTFKVARQDGYEYNILRSPSYTDRILYKALDQLEEALQVSLYEPISSFTSSDHKPIRGAFEIQLNEKLDLFPPMSESQRTDNSGETMNLLFTSIECQIEEEEYNKNNKPNEDGEIIPPNPFVSFVSTPREALELDGSGRKRATWKRFGSKKSKKKPSKSKSNAKQEKFNPFEKDWPGTKVVEESFEPKWENEEIHFELRTRKKDNSPIDLSGALLHISVFDESEVVPQLMGSFTLNLAALIKMSRDSKEEDVGDSLDAGSRLEHAMGLRKTSEIPSLQRNSWASKRLARMPSTRLMSLMETASDELDEDEKASQKLKNMHITTLNIDEALTEGGIQVGRIKCTVDAWWIQNDEDDNHP